MVVLLVFMLIAVDIDDVLADFTSAFLSYYNQENKTLYKKEDFNQPNWWESHDLPKESIMTYLFDFYQTDDFKDLSPIKDSVFGVDELSSRHKLVAITARPESTRRATEEWFDKHFYGKFQEIFFTNLHILDKNNGLNKGEICKKLNVDLLIDDLPAFCNECSDNGIKSFVFSVPWNANIELDDCMTRVNSWKDIVERL